MLFKILVNSLVLFNSVIAIDVSSEPIHRNKRQLLYPNSTLFQLNIGIGTPSPAELINVNWAIQANFQLPWNRTQIPIDILDANSGYTGPSRMMEKRSNDFTEYENDARLYHFYKYIEGILNGLGYNGTACILRMLCQVGAEPLQGLDEEDLLHELADFALNPKNDLEHTEYKSEIYPYVEAYERGETTQDCIRVYEPCTLSLIDLFSKPHSVP